MILNKRHELHNYVGYFVFRFGRTRTNCERGPCSRRTEVVGATVHRVVVYYPQGSITSIRRQSNVDIHMPRNGDSPIAAESAQCVTFRPTLPIP